MFDIYPVASNGDGISFISSTHKLVSLPKDEPHLRQIVGSGSPPPLSWALCLYAEWAAILALSTAAACLPLSQRSSAGAVVGLFWPPPPQDTCSQPVKCRFYSGPQHAGNTEYWCALCVVAGESVRPTCHTGWQIFGRKTPRCPSNTVVKMMSYHAPVINNVDLFIFFNFNAVWASWCLYLVFTWLPCWELFVL